MNKNKTIIAAIILLFLSVLTYYFVYKKNKYLSPLGTGQILSSASVLSHDTKIIGFLPYWNLKNEASIDFSVLDELIYFGLAVDDKGNFIKMTDTGYEDPGWTWFKSDSLLQIKNLAHKKNKQILFSVNALNNELINSIVSDPKTQDRLIKNIIDTLKQYEFDGVNVDFQKRGITDKH